VLSSLCLLETSMAIWLLPDTHHIPGPVLLQEFLSSFQSVIDEVLLRLNCGSLLCSYLLPKVACSHSMASYKVTSPALISPLNSLSPHLEMLKHLKFIISQTKFLIPLPKTCPILQYFLSVNDNTIPIVGVNLDTSFHHNLCMKSS
jgi:hypothetical protein